jgi:hypothetical protein
VTPASSVVWADLSTPVGGTVNPELYGASLHSGDGQGYDSFDLPKWCASVRKLDLRYIRLLGTKSMSTLFPRGATTVEYQVMRNMSPLINNFAAINFTGTLNWTAGVIHDEKKAVDYTTQAGQATLARQMVSLAACLRSSGIKVDIWDIFNEPDYEGIDQSTVANASAACFHALKEFDPACRVGGPTQGYGPYNYTTSFLAANPSADFLIYHHYDNHGPFHGNNMSSDMALYQHALDHGPKVMSMVKGGSAQPMICNEYAINSAFTSPDWDPRQQRIQGVLYTALLTLSGAKAGLWGAAVWDLAARDNYFTIVDKDGHIFPIGHFLSKAGRTLPGVIVKSNVPPDIGDVVALATTHGCGYALMVINYGTTPLTMPVAITGASGLRRWEQSPAHMSGTEMIITGADLASQSFPATSIVIFHNGRKRSR